VLDDNVLEGSESVVVTLDSISGDPDIAIDGTADSATVTITDEDTALVSITASDPTAAEPSDDGQFTVSLTNAADTDTQTEVLRLLGADQSGRASRVCLIGLRGAGKSTLGAAVGDALGVAFLELNDVIAEFAGIPVSEIMALYGIEGYRRLEADALEKVIEDHDRLILAAAGGIVGDGAVFTRLLEKFHTIWLRATPEDHMERVRAQGDTRPMAGNPAAMAELTAILTSREAQYAQAGAQMNTSGCSPKEARDALARLIANRGFLRALS
jgi:XRE family aerobic/anaerobic benzoate catabolism transcriptional regulator